MTQKSHSTISLDSDWMNNSGDEQPATSPKKTESKPPLKPCSQGYQSDSSISWIFKQDDSDTENASEEDDSITESPLTDEKLKQKASEWDMSIINSTGSDDELYNDPSTSGRSLNKPSSRFDMTEKMNRSNSSLLTLELLRDEGGEEKQESSSLIKSGFSLATEYIHEDDQEKGLRFNPALDVQEYMTRDEYTEEEFFKCFYTQLESNLMLESRNKVIDKINRGKMKNQDSLRGLEYWVESTSTQIDRRVDSMIQRVMDEQDIQIENGYDDPMKLAELSLSVSIESMAVALKIASRDAKVARKAYRLMFEKHELEMDGQTMKSNGTASTAALSSVVLPESLELKSKKTKIKDIDDSNRSTRSSSSRKSAKSTGSKKMKKRNSDSSSKKSSKRNSLKKQSLNSSERSTRSIDSNESGRSRKSTSSKKSKRLDSSERSVGSAKSTSSKKSKKSKKRNSLKKQSLNSSERSTRSIDSNESGRSRKETIVEDDQSVDSDAGVSHKKMKKRKSLDKKRRSSASDIKVKNNTNKNKQSDDGSTASSKKGTRKSTGSVIEISKANKDKRRSSGASEDIGSPNSKDKRRSSAPAALKRDRSSSSSSNKQLTSSLSSEEDEYLDKTKNQSKNHGTTPPPTPPAHSNPASAPEHRRSYLQSSHYKEMGSSWLQFLQDRGDLTEDDIDSRGFGY